MLYDDTFSLNILIDIAIYLFATLIEMTAFNLKTAGKNPDFFFSKIVNEIKNFAFQYRDSVQGFYDKAIANDKIQKSDFFLRQTFSCFAGYLNRKKENALTMRIDKALLREQREKPHLFISKGYFYDYSTANSMGVEYFTEGQDIKNVEKKLCVANELIKKFIGEENIGYFYQKIFFREAFILDTEYNGKKRYTSDIVRKLLNDDELSPEERIFFSHKVHRGKFREFDILHSYEAYSQSISEASNLYLEVFKWLDFKLCVQQIDYIFSKLMDLVLVAYKEQVKKCKCKK